MINNYSMFSIFKKKEPVIRVPQWSRVANATEYTVFKRAVLHYFKNDDIQLNFNEGIAKFSQAKLLDGNVINLIELYKLCLSRGSSESFLATIEAFMAAKQYIPTTDVNLQYSNVAKN